MSDYFTSDLHLGHANIIQHENRPFSSVEEHDAELVRRWNQVVQPNDTVYVLGDIGFVSSGDKGRLIALLRTMNGTIHLIRGNHDHNNVEKPGIRERFYWIKDIYMYRGQLDGEKIRIVLCHYPIERWERSQYGVWHLHGHCHGSLPKARMLRFDVGCMLHDYRPLSLVEVVRTFEAMVFWGIGPVFHHGEDQNDD